MLPQGLGLGLLPSLLRMCALLGYLLLLLRACKLLGCRLAVLRLAVPGCPWFGPRYRQMQLPVQHACLTLWWGRLCVKGCCCWC